MKLSLSPKLMVFSVSGGPPGGGGGGGGGGVCRFFFQSHPVYDQTQGSGCCVCLTLRITLLHTTYLQNQKPRYKF
jgi:hypothetical protein